MFRTSIICPEKIAGKTFSIPPQIHPRTTLLKSRTQFTRPITSRRDTSSITRHSFRRDWESAFAASIEQSLPE